MSNDSAFNNGILVTAHATKKSSYDPNQSTALYKRSVKYNIFFLILQINNVIGTPQNVLGQAISKSTHKICFHGEIRKNNNMYICIKINIKKIAFGNKEHINRLENGSLGFIETLHKQ